MRETGAYIIVSDVHLGSKKCNYNEFCYFLEWIRDLENKPKIIKCKDKEITIKYPSKIILLGDIFELWDPKYFDRDNVIKDFMRSFFLLSGIDCNKIYVAGNHDDSLGELEAKINHETLNKGTRFDVHNRHYSKKDKKLVFRVVLKSEIGHISFFMVISLINSKLFLYMYQSLSVSSGIPLIGSKISLTSHLLKNTGR